MRICKIWDGEYPWDVRVDKVATALAEAGDQVHVVCRNISRRPSYEWNGIFSIHRLPLFPRLPRRLHSIANFPQPLNPVWTLQMARIIRDTRTELILVRDILLMLPALVIGRMCRIPVVLDMAENYAAMLEDKRRFDPTSTLAQLVRSPSIVRRVEQLCTRLADHVIVVVEESQDRLTGCGVPFDKISIVRNTPRLDSEDYAASIPNAWRPSSILNLIYFGNLDGSRGMDIAVSALPLLSQSGCTAHLWIIGDGPSVPRLKKLTQTLGVDSIVTFTGHLSLHLPTARMRVREIMRESHIGLVPHYATESWNTTIPNKLFDYMRVGLPVIVSTARPAARIVTQEQCGEVFSDRDPVALARCITALKDAEKRGALGSQGRAAVQHRYNWREDSRILVEALRKIRHCRPFQPRPLR